MVYPELVSSITNIEIIAEGHRIRQIGLLRRLYGDGNWRKLKGLALVRLPDGTIARAEIHWYEAHGIGRRRMKVKRTL